MQLIELKSAFICNFIITSVVFEIWLKLLLKVLTNIYDQLKYTLIYFVI